MLRNISNMQFVNFNLVNKTSNYFKNYKSYKTYYKAQITEYNYKSNEFKLNFQTLKSYNTVIGILINESYLILNKDYYNCSKTTSEQLHYFLSFYPCINQKIYLKNDQFYDLNKYLILNELENFMIFLNSINYQFEKEKHFLKKLDNQKFLKNLLKTSKILNIENKHKKTVTKKIITITKENIKLSLSFSVNKHNRITTKIKYKLLSNSNLLTIDLRNFNEKQLYNGYDMGIKNNKNLIYEGY